MTTPLSGRDVPSKVPSVSTQSASTSDEWRAWSTSLDVFKGIAALAMVVNHAGYALLTPEVATSGVVGFAVFMGSMAPVLFFFATGVGGGLRPADASLDWVALWKKAAWLMLADQFLLWSSGHRFGMDFFGFIALSMLVVGWVTSRPRPELWCAALIAVLLTVRYVMRDVVLSTAGDKGLLAWITGVSVQPGWSYPLSPWLVAPLAGFWAARRLPRVPQQRRTLAAVCAVLLGSMTAAWLFQRGVSFFRWGVVSGGFVLAAMTTVAAAWGASRVITTKCPRLVRTLSLRGASALLVVPIHYAALALLREGGFPQIASTLLAVVAVLLLAGLVLPASRGLANLLADCGSRCPPASWAILLLLLLGVAWSPVAPLWLTLACCLAQVAVAAQFGRR